MSADGRIIPFAYPAHGPALDVAVIGSGIAGLGAAWLLSRRHRVTLYEKDLRPGGHANTIDVAVDGRTIPVDTGFIVYNERNYPNLTRLFALLGVASHASSMSFGVSIDNGRREYSGGSWSGLFAQPSNLLRPGHYAMLLDIVRFFREAHGVAAQVDEQTSLGEWLARCGYRRRFIFEHLLPMGAAIWSAPVRQILEFPAISFVRFFQNHGLLSLTERPQWRTVSGGARTYVQRLLGDFRDGALRLGARVACVRPGRQGVSVIDAQGNAARFDRVVIAAHGDQALRMLDGASARQYDALSAIRYQRNSAVLHSDERLMPRRRRAWSSWNYLAETGAEGAESAKFSVTYWMNRLQAIATDTPLLVSLNPLREPRAERVFARFEYDHPVFDAQALRAQRSLGQIQGENGVYLCGAWCGYGFHEDGLASGLAVAEMLGVRRPWAPEAKSPIAFGSAPVMPGRAAAGPGD
jgi:uncharacterized protein